jgi:cell division transport system permease protein
MSEKDKDARVKLQQNKKLRRRWLTWVRMARYGANNFTRNAWLTTAATAVMTITLLIILTTIVARSVLVNTVNEFKQRVDFSIYLKVDVKSDAVEAMKTKLSKVNNVNSVRYINTEDAKKSYIEQNKPSSEQLQAISELPPELNPFLPSLRVVVKDPNDTKQLNDLVTNDSDFQANINPDPRRKPSFSGERKGVIETIGRWAQLAERGGIIASLVFIAISMLIIFNTIRMAIFNRRDEIEMMKLIGAERGFIRGPFVVEAVMYGFFAALVATTLGYLMMVSVEAKLASYGIAVAGTRDVMITFGPLVLICMILLGAIIGSVSARLAVRRYLRV